MHADESNFPSECANTAGRQLPGAIFGASRASAVGMDQGYVGGACETKSVDQTVRVNIEVRAIRNFADALVGAMDGKRVTRAGWNAGGQYVAMQLSGLQSKMIRPYLYLKNAQNEIVPWVPSQGDLFACDWAILPN